MVCWIGGPARFGQRPQGRFNVLLITVDTTRADHLGCYGGTATRTPHMDRLADDGVLFQRCSTSSVMTLPSHCTIMTGLYPFVHGVRRNGGDPLPAAAVTLAEVFKEAGFATAAALGSYVLDRRFGLAQGFDEYRDVPPVSGTPAAGAQRKGDQVCDDALELLRQRAQQRFFLWAHFYDPHYPYESPRHPDVGSAAAYADEVSYMDGEIGRLLNGLRELGLESSTLVVLVGDHGEGLDEHLEYQHGYFVYETCQQVPFLMRGPGLGTAGRQIDAVVRTADLAPTILELAGLPPLESISGVSLVPLLAEPSTDLPRCAYAETVEPYALLRLARIRTFTAGRWKYIWSTSPQLFDLESDPGELHNRIAEQPAVADALHEELRALLAEAPPAVRADRSAPLTPGELARLESLGYVGAVADAHPADVSELDTFEPEGRDAHEYAALIRTYEYAREAIGRGRLAEAESGLRSVLAVLPEAPSALRDLAHVQRQQGRQVAAAQTYEQALKVSPRDARTRVQYASLLMDQRLWEEAADQARQALLVRPSDLAAHMILGAAYERLDRLDEACAHLETVAQLDPRVVSSMYALGQLYFRLRRFSDAAECFQRVLAVEPEFEPAQAGLRATERVLRR